MTSARGHGAAPNSARAKISGRHDSRLGELEKLVDELIKDAPDENRIRTFMDAAGLKYSTDAFERMSAVLTALDRVRGMRPNPMKDQV